MLREFETGKGLVTADLHMDLPFVESKHGQTAAHLESALRQSDWTIDLGDRIELWRVSPRQRHERIRQIGQSGWGGVIRATRRIPNIQIGGNHDETRWYEHAPDPYWNVLTNAYEFSYGDREYIAFHGHAFDIFGKVMDLIGRNINDGWFARFRRLDRWFLPHRDELPHDRSLYQRWARFAVWSMRQMLRDGQTAVIGHFHLVLDDRDHEKKRVISPGLSTRDTLRFIRFGKGRPLIFQERLTPPGFTRDMDD